MDRHRGGVGQGAGPSWPAATGPPPASSPLACLSPPSPAQLEAVPSPVLGSIQHQPGHAHPSFASGPASMARYSVLVLGAPAPLTWAPAAFGPSMFSVLSDMALFILEGEGGRVRPRVSASHSGQDLPGTGYDRTCGREDGNHGKFWNRTGSRVGCRSCSRWGSWLP